MTKEEIIATAIREAFLCGKEAGEASQRQWHSMQQKIEDAKQGNPDYDQHQYDGVMPVIELAKLKEENEKLGKILEEKDAIITELRTELQANKDADTLLCDENKRLLASLNEKDAIIAELRVQNDKLYAYVNPLAIIKPQDEEFPIDSSTCIHFSEGDQVIISRAFFDENEEPDLHGTILSVLDDSCVVLITEEDSVYDDAEFVIRNEYITNA